MDDKPRIARVTALLAANAYALIQTMLFVERTPDLPKQAALLTLIPTIGLGLSYALLERPVHRPWDELRAGAPLVVMLVLWILRQVFV